MFGKKKGIEIHLDKKRYLYLGLKEAVVFENLIGKPLFLRKTIESLNEKGWATLLYCALLHEGLSEEEVTRIYEGLTLENVKEVSKKLLAAWLDAQK